MVLTALDSRKQASMKICCRSIGVILKVTRETCAAKRGLLMLYSGILGGHGFEPH